MCPNYPERKDDVLPKRFFRLRGFLHHLFSGVKKVTSNLGSIKFCHLEEAEKMSWITPNVSTWKFDCCVRTFLLDPKKNGLSFFFQVKPCWTSGETFLHAHGPHGLQKSQTPIVIQPMGNWGQGLWFFSNMAGVFTSPFFHLKNTTSIRVREFPLLSQWKPESNHH